MKIIRAIFDFIIYNFVNIFVGLLNIFVWRDKKVLLFGSWFGEKFADNSRFLFEYLSENKEKYKLKRVIWITRNKDVYNDVSSLGYDVLYAHSIKSYYYHLKSGVHFICNNASFHGHKRDILTTLSFGAKKIQLWHGVGIKSCGRLSKKNPNSIFTYIYYYFICRFGQPGMWGLCYYLVTSEENQRVAIEDYAAMKKRIIIAQYPRLIRNYKLTLNEKRIIDKVIAEKRKKKIILFVPTFRASNSNYISPQSINGFDSFLSSNSLLWIQKKHSADRNLLFSNIQSDNIYELSSDFDINLLYQFVDLVITDYSSASSDAIYWDKLTLEYCPDFDYYKSLDRGFVTDFQKYHVFEPVTDPKFLFDSIISRFENNPKNIRNHLTTKEFLFGNKLWNMDDIYEKIKEVAKL